jgi:serpin B
MRNFVEILSSMLALAVLLSACGSPRPSASVAQSSLKRVEDPAVPGEDLSSLVQGNNAFAMDLYHSLRSGNGNLAFSPYSLSVALAMPYAGARGSTETQMAQALHYTLPQDRLHPAFNRLDLNLAKEGQAASNEAQPMQLKIANAVWAEQTFSFLQSYLDLVAQHYGAGIRLADIIHNADGVRQEINNWVSQQTNNKIKDLIPAGAMDDATRMVLVNAIYFKADWANEFDPANTKDAPFTLLDGTQVTSKQMSDHFSGVPYASGDGWQAIELPYVGDTAAMDLIVPEAGHFQDFETSLDASELDTIIKSMQPVTIQLAMPKFSFRSTFDMGGQLAGLGVSDAFDTNSADFSGMTGKRDLYITKVVHQAYIAVDEKGTEAAAATGVVMGLTAIMIPDKQLTIDHPFLFVIRDVQSGQILFVGRVMDPTK